MIIDQTITIFFNSIRSSKWKKYGYGSYEAGNTYSIHVFSLPKEFKSIKIDYKCDSCGIIKQDTYANLNKKNIHLCRTCDRAKCVNHMNKTRPKDYFPKKERHWNWNPNRETSREFYFYAKKCRKITEETYTKYKEEINPNNYPRLKAGSTNGYHLDHKIPIKWGFMRGLNPKIIGSVDNLQMLPWKENIQKRFLHV